MTSASSMCPRRRTLCRRELKSKEFTETVCLNEAAPGTCRQHIPTVVLWNLNALEGKSLTDPATHLHQHVATLKGILLVQDAYGVGLIIHRRNPPPGKMTRRAFHNELASTLEEEGLDCDMDLAFNYKVVSRHRTPLVLTAWLVFLKASAAGNRFSWTNLVRGSLTDLDQANYNEMCTVPDIDILMHYIENKCMDIEKLGMKL